MCGVLGALTLGGDPAPPSLAMLGCSEPWASPLRSGEGNLGPRFPGEHTGHLRCRAAANGHGKASPDQGPGSACSMRRHPDVSWQFQGAPGPPLGRTRDPNFPTEMPHGAQPCSGSGLRRAGDRGPVPAWSSYLSVHQPCPYRGHVPFSPPAPASPLGPGAPGSPGQPRRMDSLSEPSRPTSFTSAEKHRVGVRALVAGPTTGRPSRECLPQGDLVPRLRPVSLASDEGSAWQRASCLRRALARWGGVPGHPWAQFPAAPSTLCGFGQVTQPR